MSATTASGYQYAVTGDPAEIHTVSQNLAESIEGRGVPAFASKTAALAAFGTTPAGSARPYVWIEDRQGHLYWTGTAWQWAPQRNKLFELTIGSEIDTGPTLGQLVPLITMPSTALPPGNRKIQVSMRSDVTNLSTSQCVPRVFDLNRNQGFRQGLFGGVRVYQVTVGGQLPLYVASGSIAVSLCGQDAAFSSLLGFSNTYLGVYDLGPTDD